MTPLTTGVGVELVRRSVDKLLAGCSIPSPRYTSVLTVYVYGVSTLVMPRHCRNHQCCGVHDVDDVATSWRLMNNSH